MKTSLEICVDSVESAVAAECGGAQRIELVNSLVEGGLTPSLGLIRAVRSRIKIGVYVMIRPRAGDFIYSDDELAIMREDIGLAVQNKADGVVLGILTADGDVDVERTRELVELARPLEVTFHRAFDMARDIDEALRAVIRAGADRVLTSGAQPTALQGRHRIGELVRAARGAIAIMAGGGIRAENVEAIYQATGALEFHAALRSPVASPMKYRRSNLHLGVPGLDDTVHYVVSPADVQALQRAITRAHTGKTEMQRSEVSSAI